MQSSRPQWLQNTVNYLLDNIFDILTIASAGYIFIRHQFQPYGPADITVLATWIIAILGLIAVSALWQQHRRLKTLENLSQETRDLVVQRLGGPARSQDFFWPDEKAITIKDLTQANDIYVVGMVLNRAVRTHMTTFSNRLAAGANLRFIILDWQNEPLMDVMPYRSFGSHPKEWWQECIRQTEGYIEDIPSSDSNAGTLQVGYLPFFPSFGMWLVDPDEPHGQIHVEIYHHRTPAINPTFSLHAAKDAYWYGFFRKQFDLLWASCGERGRVLDIVASTAQSQSQH
jgi:hypothetical protein